MINKYFNRITVSSASFSSVSSPDVSVGFPGSISLINEGTGIIEYSFDGTNVQGDLVPGTGSQEIVFENTALNVIWFRLKSGSASAVRVEASDGGLQVGSASGSSAPITGTVSVSNFPNPQNVSGTVTANIGTSGSLALDATLTGGSQKTQVSAPLPAGTNVIGHVITDSGSTVSVSNFPATQPISGSVSISNFPATQPVSAVSLPLPSGAASSFNQTTTNNLLNAGLPAALGTSGGLKIDGSGTPLPVSGTVTSTISGSVVVAGATAAGSSASGNPEQISGVDPSGNVRRILTSTTGLLRTTYDYGVPPTSPWLTNVFTSVATTGLLVKSGAGVLRFYQVIDSLGVAANIQFFDRTTTPSAGAVPMLVTPLGSASASQASTVEGGIPFSTGIFMVLSSTLATYTAVVSTAATGIVVYA